MTETVRSFVALELPDLLKNNIDAYIQELKPFSLNTHWVNNNNLHLTLKFLGNRPAQEVDAIMQTLLDARVGLRTFHLTTDGMGAFPNFRHPKVIWLGIKSEPNLALTELQQQIENCLAVIHIEKETRPFRPHLTLGRIKQAGKFSALQDYVTRHPFPTFSFPQKSFVLMRSIQKSRGVYYRVLQKYSLQNSE